MSAWDSLSTELQDHVLLLPGVAQQMARTSKSLLEQVVRLALQPSITGAALDALLEALPARGRAAVLEVRKPDLRGPGESLCLIHLWAGLLPAASFSSCSFEEFADRAMFPSFAEDAPPATLGVLFAAYDHASRSHQGNNIACDAEAALPAALLDALSRSAEDRGASRLRLMRRIVRHPFCFTAALGSALAAFADETLGGALVAAHEAGWMACPTVTSCVGDLVPGLQHRLFHTLDAMGRSDIVVQAASVLASRKYVRAYAWLPDGKSTWLTAVPEALWARIAEATPIDTVFHGNALCKLVHARFEQGHCLRALVHALAHREYLGDALRRIASDPRLQPLLPASFAAAQRSLHQLALEA